MKEPPPILTSALEGYEQLVPSPSQLTPRENTFLPTEQKGGWTPLLV
jgi:hypothetical protein